MSINEKKIVESYEALDPQNNKFDKFMVIGATSLAFILPTMLALPYAEGKVVTLLMVQAAVAVFGIGYSLIKEQVLSESVNVLKENILNQNNLTVRKKM